MNPPTAGRTDVRFEVASRSAHGSAVGEGPTGPAPPTPVLAVDLDRLDDPGGAPLVRLSDDIAEAIRRAAGPARSDRGEWAPLAAQHWAAEQRAARQREAGERARRTVAVPRVGTVIVPSARPPNPADDIRHDPVRSRARWARLRRAEIERDERIQRRLDREEARRA